MTPPNVNKKGEGKPPSHVLDAIVEILAQGVARRLAARRPAPTTQAAVEGRSEDRISETTTPESWM